MNIVGVDVEIMNLVGKKMGKKVVIENTGFDEIIDNVEAGTKYDCGAAGITITEARKEKVNFSNPYFTSIQFVIVSTGTMEKSGTSADGEDYILWSDLAGKALGVQTNTTGDIFADYEINDENGALYNLGASVIGFDSAQTAVAALKTQVDAVIVDELPAEYIVDKNEGLECYALYYDNETATIEEYAICVNKNNAELLKAINEVLAELGEDGIDQLVKKHLGLED
jgi:polar amino acid transport system substrate-binding protein